MFSVHGKDLGTIVAAVTVSDAFFLHYLASYLIHNSNMKYLNRNHDILKGLIKLLTYTAPDPTPAGQSNKERKAAAKSGWYDRLVQAEIVLNLLNHLSPNLITDNKIREKIWKKLAPPNITLNTVPNVINQQMLDSWFKLWEKWESSIKDLEGMNPLDRSKLQKIKMTLKLKTAKQETTASTGAVPEVAKPGLKIKLKLPKQSDSPKKMISIDQENLTDQKRKRKKDKKLENSGQNTQEELQEAAALLDKNPSPAKKVKKSKKKKKEKVQAVS